MTPTYRAERTFTADGPDGMPRRFEAGVTFGPDDIMAGCLASGLRVGHVVLDDTPAPTEPAAAHDDPPPPAEQTPAPPAAAQQPNKPGRRR